MKKLIVLGVAAIVIMFTTGCNRNQIAQLESELLALRTEKEIADSLQNQFYDFLNEIEANLAEIRSREQMISQATRERPQNVKDKILQDLADISDLMVQNRTRLGEMESLRRRLREANVNTERLQTMINNLEARIAQQEAQIKELQEQLRIANERIEALRAENQKISDESARRQATIDEQTISLNTAFFTMGTTRELRDNGVITQRGGFIGIGRTRTISEEAAARNFTRIDIREFKRLETNSERIEIVTPHPAESFRLNTSNPQNIVIEITNTDLFWKSSKFLVVRVR
jgi:DNA repair exonuclease SbcCD ATPase subunit